MKAVSLHQPFASMMEIEAKRNETRSWPTSYRGDLVICSAKKKLTGQEIGMPATNRMWEHRAKLTAAGWIKTFGDLYGELPFGYAVCVVEVYLCVPSEVAALYASPLELDLGNYQPGRWIWYTRYCRRLTLPVPVVGRQRIWNLSENESRLVRLEIPT